MYSRYSDSTCSFHSAPSVSGAIPLRYMCIGRQTSDSTDTYWTHVKRPISFYIVDKIWKAYMIDGLIPNRTLLFVCWQDWRFDVV